MIRGTLAGIVLLCLLTGCASRKAPHPPDSPPPPGELQPPAETTPPDTSHSPAGTQSPVTSAQDSDDLLSLARARYHRHGPAADVSISLESAQSALDLDPGHEEAAFLCARATLWLLEFGPERPEKEARKLARFGFECAQTALAADKGRVEYVFLSGALLGLQLKHSRVPGPKRLREVHRWFEQAAEMDPSYDNGAPLRALGTMLVKAPAWPAGMGDMETGIEILEEAVTTYPNHPGNHYYLAEALAADGRDEAAHEHYEKVIELCTESVPGEVGAWFTTRATAALADSDRSGR